ncbi:uncharacterized protein MYCFIDRAFT_209031 [Pseudocercospora fijiensis CIRAD86]|uniref:Uncharacterized protein n=1 Tax=Pseudocercospora fijiensis (strain CIRAD86) TaxID=383855 RepID=M2YLN8_PSEFD|nr:uncharacterized protein MYCFIDRAFT_209031 [Pseudocercospora fijiensis CIRAD86]EME78655.1 hypothetical protein MYCFIDRAFT_209031 [Pseudocercospora fijiensis CIRAD86]
MLQDPLRECAAGGEDFYGGGWAGAKVWKGLVNLPPYLTLHPPYPGHSIATSMSALLRAPQELLTYPSIRSTENHDRESIQVALCCASKASFDPAVSRPTSLAARKTGSWTMATRSLKWECKNATLSTFANTQGLRVLGYVELGKRENGSRSRKNLAFGLSMINERMCIRYLISQDQFQDGMKANRDFKTTREIVAYTTLSPAVNPN